MASAWKSREAGQINIRGFKTRFEVLYKVRGTNIDPQVVACAIELSTTRYCPVIGMLGKVAPVATRYEIE